MTAIWRVRAAVLTLVGAIATHHGRYVFATAEHDHELAGAHAYLTWLAPVSAVLLFFAIVQLAAHLACPPRRADPELPRGRTLWLAASVTLLAAFGVQEGLETIVAEGHLPAVAEILGAGGWTAIPIALAAGGLIALALRGAATIVRWALTRDRRQVRATAQPHPAPRPPVLAAPRSVLARRLAGRGPPAVPVST